MKATEGKTFQELSDSEILMVEGGNSTPTVVKIIDFIVKTFFVGPAMPPLPMM